DVPVAARDRILDRNLERGEIRVREEPALAGMEVRDRLGDGTAIERRVHGAQLRGTVAAAGALALDQTRQRTREIRLPKEAAGRGRAPAGSEDGPVLGVAVEVGCVRFDAVVQEGIQGEALARELERRTDGLLERQRAPAPQ